MSARRGDSSPRTALWLLIAGSSLGAALVIAAKRRSTKRKSAGTAARPGPGFVPAPRPGDILLFHNARGLNKLITRFTGSPFYHAAIYAGDGRVVEARTPGVQCGDLHDRAHDFVVAPAPEGAAKSALTWAEAQIGEGYDPLDIAIVILDRLCRFIHFNYTPRNRYACAEFVAIAFDRAGVKLVPDRDTDDVVPGDFARLLPPAERALAK